MAGCDTVQVNPGDVFVIETPGGGGFGPPAATARPRLLEV
jgi:5-oxoprolinase (ATP-hydrolysing)